MYRFVSPFVNQKSKTLILFQDFFGVLDKLKLNVPLQDLAVWFGASLSILSRTFTAWLTGRILSQNKAICSVKAQVMVSSSEYFLL